MTNIKLPPTPAPIAALGVAILVVPFGPVYHDQPSYKQQPISSAKYVIETADWIDGFMGIVDGYVWVNFHGSFYSCNMLHLFLVNFVGLGLENC